MKGTFKLSHPDFFWEPLVELKLFWYEVIIWFWYEDRRYSCVTILPEGMKSITLFKSVDYPGVGIR